MDTATFLGKCSELGTSTIKSSKVLQVHLMNSAWKNSRKFLRPKSSEAKCGMCPTSSDDLSHEKISGVHPFTNAFKVNAPEKGFKSVASGL